MMRIRGAAAADASDGARTTDRPTAATASFMEPPIAFDSLVRQSRPAVARDSMVRWRSRQAEAAGGFFSPPVEPRWPAPPRGRSAGTGGVLRAGGGAGG